MRLLALVAAFVTLVAACAGPPDVVSEVPDGIGPPAADAQTTGDGPAGPAREPSPDATADHGSPTSPPAAGDAHDRGGPPGEPGGATPPVVTVDDQGPVGTMGRALLRPEVPALTIEVLVQDGAAPDGRALDHLERIVAREADKPDGVRRLQHVFRSDRRRWTADELRGLADDRRQHRSSARHAAFLVIYLRGEYEDDRVLGVALNATEVAVFPDGWRDLVGGVLGAAGNVERSVLVHEVGHLFGLVELTYDSVHDRHDGDNPGHSRDPGSVMYWAVERTAVTQVFEGPPPNDFDEADRDDLRFLRTGSW